MTEPTPAQVRAIVRAVLAPPPRNAQERGVLRRGEWKPEPPAPIEPRRW